MFVLFNLFLYLNDGFERRNLNCVSKPSPTSNCLAYHAEPRSRASEEVNRSAGPQGAAYGISLKASETFSIMIPAPGRTGATLSDISSSTIYGVDIHMNDESSMHTLVSRSKLSQQKDEELQF